MQDYEKLGAFYLGKRYDVAASRRLDDLVLYDAKDLTTHAVCVGMTGSGKTGLCLSLLEEAAIDGIPAIAIDPKGDLGNLLLTFPDLSPGDFEPWIDAAEAARNGQTVPQYARQTADRWRTGLAEWEQEGARIAKFRDSADLAIYTPGSNAGLPLTVMHSFAAPAAEVLGDADAFRERVLSTVSGLLALLGVDADPIRSREHILLSSLFDRAWRGARNLDMHGLIRDIQSPPFDKLGFMDLETIYPAADRFQLAVSLNNLLASPGFAAWMEGEPLNIQRLLYTPEGRPRLSIVSIAHLSESERMFFVTILLNEVVTWMRSQPGTSSLRALLYMDEVFGYFPPTANPPSKTPLLTLMKQARAYGLGVVLATQNPVDLDYKGLSNAGTWFLGRLQTERDKARVLDGLESASAVAGGGFDRQQIDTLLASLDNRVFLMHNVHDDEPILFQTRWALSYLRGPLTRSQIQTLMASRKSATHPAAATAGAVAAAAAATAPAVAAAPSLHDRPVLPPDIPEFFVRRNHSEPGRLVYRPALLGTARVHFVSSSQGIDRWETVSLLAAIGDRVAEGLWDEADALAGEGPDLDREPKPNSEFGELPATFTNSKSFKTWTAALSDSLYRNRTLKVLECKSLKQTSAPDVTEGDFRAKLAQQLREERDLQIEKLRKRYAPKLATLQDRMRRAEQRVQDEKSQVKQQSLQTAISFGSTLLGALFGRKLLSTSNVTRAGSALRSASRVATERADVGQARETAEVLQQKLADLQAEFDAEVEQLQDRLTPESLQVEETAIRPRKSDLTVTRVALVWTPWVVDSNGIASPAF